MTQRSTAPVWTADRWGTGLPPLATQIEKKRKSDNGKSW